MVMLLEHMLHGIWQRERAINPEDVSTTFAYLPGLLASNGFPRTDISPGRSLRSLKGHLRVSLIKSSKLKVKISLTIYLK